MMKDTIDYLRLILPPATSVRKAIQVMTGPNGAGMILVTRKDRRLLGVVVDSDIRKGILNGHGLSAPLSRVMNPRPVTLPHGASRAAIVRFFQAQRRANIPLIDERGCVRGLAQMSDYFAQAVERPNPVVLMVGGEGRRLRPLTEDRPKPLLTVGNRPILETILEQFIGAGFNRFYLAVNHQADQILRYFGDGRKLGVEIRYLHERKTLGTAGALSLLPRGFRDPVIVMNGDLLTKIDFKALLSFHKEEGHLATLCVREYDFQVPYGVVVMEDHRLQSIVEKPTHRFFVNAGIYVLEPKILKLLPRNRFFEMPQLLDKVRKTWRGSVGCFPIREYWIDIGQMNDYERAQTDYLKFFR